MADPNVPRGTHKIEPQSLYNSAIIGFDGERLLYSTEKLVIALMEHHGLDEDGALDWVQYSLEINEDEVIIVDDYVDDMDVWPLRPV